MLLNLHDRHNHVQLLRREPSQFHHAHRLLQDRLPGHPLARERRLPRPQNLSGRRIPEREQQLWRHHHGQRSGRHDYMGL